MDWGLLGYEASVCRQLQLVEDRCSEATDDSLIMVEHPPTVTTRAWWRAKAIFSCRKNISHREGIELHRVSRGGKATFHEPGQLVIYPIIKLKDNDIGLFVLTVLESAATVLRAYGLRAEFKNGRPGLWVRLPKDSKHRYLRQRRGHVSRPVDKCEQRSTGAQSIVPCGHAEEVFGRQWQGNTVNPSTW